MDESRTKPPPLPNPFWRVLSSWPGAIVASILAGMIWAGFAGMMSSGFTGLDETIRSVQDEMKWLKVFGHFPAIHKEAEAEIASLVGTYFSQCLYLIIFFAAPIAAFLLIVRDVIKQRRLSQDNVKVLVFMILALLIASITMPNY
jgi:hypothetical protein